MLFFLKKVKQTQKAKRMWSNNLPSLVSRHIPFKISFFNMSKKYENKNKFYV